MASNPDRQDDIVRRFEPVRAVLRPNACDERSGCWVKVGAPGCSGNNFGPRCNACGGAVNFRGNEASHQAALRRCMAAQNEVQR